ncbi:disease resistance protein RPM1-like isoform X1 [Prunus avium]|uniref:Disease resistance protein RPM1-like isoform X1 n=1 Tax=Prunus avium TaxID=42229 RepID=A0A6P5TTZ7_PRUAV|nr:disease resistance protein RPM1-like isoform X1 [Prunus avium]
MAESVVCLVIEKLVSLLISTEAKLSRDVRKEVGCIRDELESIRSFLMDADAKAAVEGEMDDSIKTWVRQVREAAYYIEDAIDEYLLCITRHHQDRGFLHKITRLVKKMKPRDEIASKIEAMKTLVSEIKARHERYGSNSSEQGQSSREMTVPWHDPRVASLFIQEAEVVGIESARDELINWLVKGASKHECREVISVLGMGGLGKTTLAKKVYDNQKVIAHFDCHAWITVSQSYNVEDLLRMMIRQFCKSTKEYIPEGIDTMDQESLIIKSREYLQQKRYVVVFDDVWKVDFWGAMEHALPDDKAGRIMITTRIKDVADFCKKSCFVHVHHLQPLPPNKAWELFCRKTFQFELEGNCPQELEELSHEIVRKCEGLPLAIVSIGGLLSTKDKSLSQWKKLYGSLSSELESNPHLTSLTRILSFSYHHLPYYLKSCVLYFGIFPEDCSISCTRLLRLWIAEGFVKSKKGKTLEEVGEEYLTELIHRSLVQVSRVYIDGKARSCRVHDLVREVLLRKGMESSFCHMLSEHESNFTPVTRRLSIDSSPSDALRSIEQSHIRSVLAFNQEEWPKSFLNTLSGNFKLLKVLDFADAPIYQLPKYVGDLYLLKYLSLRNTKVKLLPDSIGNLQNLETLNLKQCLVYEIPAKINKLLKLRHLLACYCDKSTDFSMTYYERGVKIHDGIGCLQALQKLCHVEANHGGINLIKALGNLRQLRRLGLKNLKSEDGRALCASIEKMNHLQSLEVSTISEDEVLDLKFLLNPPKFVRFLYLKGPLENFPSWVPKLQQLIKLRIFWSRLRDSPLKPLQNLPHLQELGFSYKAYDGVQLHFEGGFEKLRVLKLKHLKGLSSLIIDNGVMPDLQELHIGPSPQLKEVPSGIHHLRNLRTLRFVDMPKEFPRHMHPNNGQHYWVVEHIQDVLFSYKFGPRCGVFETHTLRDSSL